MAILEKLIYKFGYMNFLCVFECVKVGFIWAVVTFSLGDKPTVVQ